MFIFFLLIELFFFFFFFKANKKKQVRFMEDPDMPEGTIEKYV